MCQRRSAQMLLLHHAIDVVGVVEDDLHDFLGYSENFAVFFAVMMPDLCLISPSYRPDASSLL